MVMILEMAATNTFSAPINNYLPTEPKTMKSSEEGNYSCYVPQAKVGEDIDEDTKRKIEEVTQQ